MSKILITGGCRGIGAACVRHFTAAGHTVAFTYKSNAEAAAALCGETGASAFRCDQRSGEAVEQLKRELPFTPEILICNAGIAWTGLFQDMTEREWDDLMDTNVKGAFLITKAFLPSMISRQNGCIVYMSSMWGQVGASCEAAYSASKAALIGMTKALAKEVGGSGVRVNCVCPGVIDTDMMNGYSKEDKEALRQDTPLERIGTPGDVAKAVAFLCGEDSSFITGHVLSVNGGFSIS
ncbi:MAG: 3-oxoacyl-ACP reductase [Clostridiales bacterium]|nr:3-oxoacyl-ACP reductase [Clostridiales bacterium]